MRAYWQAARVTSPMKASPAASSSRYAVITAITSGRTRPPVSSGEAPALTKTRPASQRTPSNSPSLSAASAPGGSPLLIGVPSFRFMTSITARVFSAFRSWPRCSRSSSLAMSRGVVTFSRPARAAPRSIIRRRRSVSSNPQLRKRRPTLSMPTRSVSRLAILGGWAKRITGEVSDRRVN